MSEQSPISTQNYYEVVKDNKEGIKNYLYSLIFKSGLNGITSDVLESTIGIPKNKWSGRLTDLVEDERIKINGKVKKGRSWFGILVAMEHIKNEEINKIDENGQIKLF